MAVRAKNAQYGGGKMLLFRLQVPPRSGNHVAALKNRLREFRDKAGLSQEDVAPRLGKSRTSISRHEAGIQEFTLDDLQIYAEIYGCSPVELIVDTAAVADSEEERDAIIALRRMSPADRTLAVQLLRKMG